MAIDETSLAHAIEIDGDCACSVCYFHNPMGLSGPDVSMFWCGGRYLDELVRTPEGWRICHRIDEVQYMHGLSTPSLSSHRD